MCARAGRLLRSHQLVVTAWSTLQVRRKHTPHLPPSCSSRTAADATCDPTEDIPADSHQHSCSHYSHADSQTDSDSLTGSHDMRSLPQAVHTYFHELINALIRILIRMTLLALIRTMIHMVMIRSEFSAGSGRLGGEEWRAR